MKIYRLYNTINYFKTSQDIEPFGMKKRYENFTNGNVGLFSSL